MTLNLIRAAISAALSIFFVSNLAQAKIQKSETHKDIIDKAYNLGLQKDRQQALIILSNAIRQEKNLQNISELKKATLNLSNIFFSDKAQQLYEVGVSLRKSDPSQAMEKFNEVLRIEQDNFTILIAMSQMMIARGDCKGAYNLLQPYFLLVSFDESLRLALAQSLVCQGKWLEYQKTAESLFSAKSTAQKFWLSLELARFFAFKNYSKAADTLIALEKLDDHYPELYYWRWKMKNAQQKKGIDEAQKYVMMCKNISVYQYRQYMIDPMLCRRTNEAEMDLKGLNGSSD